MPLLDKRKYEAHGFHNYGLFHARIETVYASYLADYLKLQP